MMEGEFRMFSDCFRRIFGLGIRVFMWIFVHLYANVALMTLVRHLCTDYSLYTNVLVHICHTPVDNIQRNSIYLRSR